MAAAGGGNDITEAALFTGVRNKATVEALYKALLGKVQMGTVAKLVASDLEWWFHGPPECQHMMRMLTGETAHNKAGGFRFEPRSATAIGEHVVTEGWEGKAYWVHVWTLKNGMITQLREYFNTWLVVRDLRVKPNTITTNSVWEQQKQNSKREGYYEDDDNDDEDYYEEERKRNSMTLWQSQPRDLYRRSLPGLVLAI